MRKFYFLMAVLGLTGVVIARAGTNTLPTETAGKIQLSHVNKFKTALTEDIVPRNSSGVATTAGGSLGSATYRWDNVWSDNFKFRRADSSHAVTVRGPAALAAAYSLVWPAALPGSTLPLLLDTSGNISTGTVTSAMITEGTIQHEDLADNSVRTSEILDANVTAAKIESSVNLPGSEVRVNGKHVMTSSTNASTNLMVIRGTVSAAGAVLVGEGFSVTKLGTGVYRMDYSNSFASTPVVVGSRDNAIGFLQIDTVLTSSHIFRTYTSASASVDSIFHFIAIGPR